MHTSEIHRTFGTVLTNNITGGQLMDANGATDFSVRKTALAVALCLSAPFSVWAAQAATLSGCASHTPPFVVFSKGTPVGGFSYELFQNIATQLQRKPVVTRLPWARCLQEVKAGSIDMAIDAYVDAERRKTFLYSAPYHALTPQVFYRANATIDPKLITEAKDLEKFKGCGVREFTYEHYELDASKLDRGAADDLRMLLKLQAGQCDYAVEEREYIVGARASVANWLDESDLRSFQPQWAVGPRNHFLIGKLHPQGNDLLQQVNQAIAGIEKAGTTAALRNRYFEAAAKRPRKP